MLLPLLQNNLLGGLSATVTCVSTTTATAVLDLGLTTQVDCVSACTADLSQIFALASTVTGASTTTADLEVVLMVDLMAVCTASSAVTCTGPVTVSGPVPVVLTKAGAVSVSLTKDTGAVSRTLTVYGGFGD